jgi:flagellar protein FlaJ
MILRKSKKPPFLQKKRPTLTSRYKTISYRLIGKRLTKNRRFDRLSELLKMANVKYPPGVYLSLIIITGTLVTLISLILFTFLFNILLQSQNWLYYVLILTGITSGISFAFYPMVIKSKISSRRTQIDHELPFILSELSILASTGLTPIKIMRHMAERGETTTIYSEFRKIIYKIDVEGKDIITAISIAAKETPSNTFREALWDLSNMIHEGGDLDEYLRKKADTTLQLKRDIQKEFIEKLSTYSEMYISLVLISVLFIGIAAFLLDAMGSTAAGLNADSLLLLLAYGLIPIAVFAINVIVSMAYSKSG